MTEKLLLLSCCAPCSVAVIKDLADKKENFAVVFYNPNIAPEEEYKHRLTENKRICEAFRIPFIELDYDPANWHERIKGFEKEPERGKRCDICFHMRLKKAMEYARENGFTYVASVLGASRHKDLNQVNGAANKASHETGIPYKQIEARKMGMQELRHELIKELEIYEQPYCGCFYSIRP